MNGDVRLLALYTNDSDEPPEHSHYLEITLSEVCETCDGHGKVADFDTEHFAVCVDCEGKGLVLTFAGEQILAFIREWAPGPQPERVEATTNG